MFQLVYSQMDVTFYWDNICYTYGWDWGISESQLETQLQCIQYCASGPTGIQITNDYGNNNMACYLYADQSCSAYQNYMYPYQGCLGTTGNLRSFQCVNWTYYNQAWDKRDLINRGSIANRTFSDLDTKVLELAKKVPHSTIPEHVREYLGISDDINDGPNQTLYNRTIIMKNNQTDITHSVQSQSVRNSTVSTGNNQTILNHCPDNPKIGTLVGYDQVTCKGKIGWLITSHNGKTVWRYTGIDYHKMAIAQTGGMVRKRNITEGQKTKLDKRTDDSTFQFRFFNTDGTSAPDPNQDGTGIPGGTDGLPAGTYRLATINTASNGQPVLCPISQHGSCDDMIYFTMANADCNYENMPNDGNYYSLGVLPADPDVASQVNIYDDNYCQNYVGTVETGDGYGNTWNAYLFNIASWYVALIAFYADQAGNTCGL